MTAWPWVTQCRRCNVIACRGLRSTCQMWGRRTPKGRDRLCQGPLVRRYDLEEAVCTAAALGGVTAADQLLLSLNGTKGDPL